MVLRYFELLLFPISIIWSWYRDKKAFHHSVWSSLAMEMKEYALLYCLDRLVTEHKLDKKDVLAKFKLAEPTFDHYKRKLRGYLKTFYPTLRLEYRRAKDTYYLFSDPR